jgi:gamma-glutamyltranspeptidase/glutathione hydrolase
MDTASGATPAASTFLEQTLARPITEVWGRRAMVSTMHPDATLAGLEILRAGGRAVDSAVAVATTLAVTNHNWSGLAGDSAWLIYDNRTQSAIHLDGYSICPPALTPQRLVAHFGLDETTDPSAFREEPEGHREFGIITALIPGTPAALHTAWQRFGNLPFERLLEAAIDRAANGTVVSSYVAGSLQKCSAKLQRFAASREVFFRPDQAPWQKGEMLIQRDLAETLRHYARNPEHEFSGGRTAGLILDCAHRAGVALTRDDLENYRPVWREPVSGSYRGRRVVTTAPPTAGLHVVQTLNILERLLAPEMTYASADTLHLLIEALKCALADRRVSGGDPDHASIPVSHLIDKDYARALAQMIDPLTARHRLADSLSTAVGTTHFVVIDDSGNVVSATQTIGRDFGCGEVVPGTGLVMNDRSWWMSLRDGPNAVAPGHRANIGHAPTIVFDGKQPSIILGSPGGFGIVPYVVQTLVNVVDYGLDLQQAIEAPRFRLMDLESTIAIEDRFSRVVLDSLRARGHNVDLLPHWSDRVGGVEGIARDRKTGSLLAGYDPRRNSYAAGL